ncbi:MAG: hypothetical protein ACRC7W_02230 [Fusobacteriaceae bacterium]
MLIVKELEEFNIKGAIRGMRNPLNSWKKSDSVIHSDYDISVGENDLNLMRRLYKAGSDHRKYLRQMLISLDITAPLYWWKEFDTYKVGTTANSTSTMHKIMSREFNRDDFSYDFDFRCCNQDEGLDLYLGSIASDIIESDIEKCNKLREMYLNGECKNNKDVWRLLIQTLPSSYNQTRTVTMNYENAYNIYHSRKNHKLSEWLQLCDAFKELPYFMEIME